MARSSERAMLAAVSALNSGSTWSLRAAAEAQEGFHHHISWSAGVASGAVTIEVADSSTYAGTWAPVAVVTFAGTAPNQDYVYSPGEPKAIRHRISTVVVGGTVTTSMVGNN